MKLPVVYILAFLAGAALVYGCTDHALSAERAFDALGQPVAKVVARASASSDQDVQTLREYTTRAGVRIVVIRDRPGCEIHYFVNASGIVSGYMFAGDQCTTYNLQGQLWEKGLVPTGSTVD
jgi:hypothetical protein